MKKKILIGITVLFFAALIVFTFVSKSVYDANLPRVSIFTLSPGTMEQNVTVTGELYYPDTEQDSLCVRYRLPAEAGKTFASPDIGTATVQTVVTDCETGNETLVGETLRLHKFHSLYDEETDDFVITAEAEPTEARVVLRKGAEITLKTGVYQFYQAIAPESCVQRDAEGEFIWVLMERDSLFGVENYVLRMGVTVSTRLDGFAAVDYNTGAQVVMGFTRPLRSGGTVVAE